MARLCYSLGWLVASGIAAWLLTICVIAALYSVRDSGDDPMTVGGIIGVVFGALIGVMLANATWRARRLHAVLVWVGAGIATLGVLLGVVFVVRSGEVARDNPGWFSGLTEVLIAALCFLVAVLGGGLLLAGISGRIGNRAQPTT